MSEPRVVAATFSDFRIVKGRKVAQLIMEVPVENLMLALNNLGQPGIETDNWCMIQNIEKPVASGVHREHSDPARQAQSEPATGPKDEGAHLVQQCAIACGDWRFRQFLHQCGHGKAKDADEAAAIIRARLGINSRSELATNPRAQNEWKLFYSTYQQWFTDMKYAEARRP